MKSGRKKRGWVNAVEGKPDLRATPKRHCIHPKERSGRAGSAAVRSNKGEALSQPRGRKAGRRNRRGNHCRHKKGRRALPLKQKEERRKLKPIHIPILRRRKRMVLRAPQRRVHHHLQPENHRMLIFCKIAACLYEASGSNPGIQGLGRAHAFLSWQWARWYLRFLELSPCGSDIRWNGFFKCS